MQVDYLIIGQGISGTLLSRALIKVGASVLVIDDAKTDNASKVASGVINPVTGMRHVRSWMIDTLLPYAQNTYEALESELNISIVRQCNISDHFPTRDAQELFSKKATELPEYLSVSDGKDQEAYFRFNYGVGNIAPCLLIDINSLLKAWRKRLLDGNSLLEESFDWQQCLLTDDGVSYKNISAKKMICCDGVSSVYNPHWELLPWSKDKGEALIVSIPGLPDNCIYKQHINIVPWQNGLFWVGASHDWKFTDMMPSQYFREQTIDRLKYWLRLPFTVTDHIVSQRPANFDRKPFSGLHPQYPALGILNGMGSKGCSMSPYFADEFAAHLTTNAPITHDVDVKRYIRILSR